MTISFIIQEHNEKDFIEPMIRRIEALPMDKELVLVSSSLYSSLHLARANFPVRVIGNIQACGEARNVGAQNAKYENLIFTDCHVCFDEEGVRRLLQTLDAHPNAAVAPAIQPCEFPSCEPSGGLAHGVAFRFTEDRVWEWVWLPAERTDMEFKVPTCCGCAVALKKSLFLKLFSFAGFLHSSKGLGAEEEFGFRLWRIADGVFIEPRAVFGHLFKGYGNHPKWDNHSTAGFYESRVAAIYVNVFDKELCSHISALCKKHWGEEWDKNLSMARVKYRWVREKLRPLKDKVDERWFFRVE